MGGIVLQSILKDVMTSVPGTRAVIFLDGEGESIAETGESAVDMKMLGAWKEIHLDSIREITTRLGLGDVQAVLFSLDEGNELIVPVGDDYCLLLRLSLFAPVQDALAGVKRAVELLSKEVA